MAVPNGGKGRGRRDRWLVAVYIRLSREDGGLESGSVKNQREILTDFVEKYLGSSDYEIVGYYTDDGMTGTTDDTRDAFRRMIADMEAGQINCIVCKSLSRAFRNYADQGRYLEQVFPRARVRFIAMERPLVDSYADPDAISQGIEIPINGLLNDRFAAKTSQEVRRTFDMKRSRGQFIGAFAPYGYKKDPDDKNRLLIDEEAARNVRRIYKWYLEGLSKSGIAKRLNAELTPNPSLYKRRAGLNYKNPNSKDNLGAWRAKTVNDILCNRTYTGAMVQGRQKVLSYKVHERLSVPEEDWVVVEGTHEAIISDTDFSKAQSLNERRAKAPPKQSEACLFSGFVRCSGCGRALRRKRGGKEKDRYYVCRTRDELGGCRRRTVREDALEKAVLEAVRLHRFVLGDPEDIRSRIENAPVGFDDGAGAAQSAESLRRELARLERRYENLYIDYADGLLAKDEYLRLKGTFAGEISSVREALQRLENNRPRAPEQGSGAERLFDSFLTREDGFVLTRAFLLEFIDMICLHEDKRITIKLKYSEKHPAEVL